MKGTEVSHLLSAYIILLNISKFPQKDCAVLLFFCHCMRVPVSVQFLQKSIFSDLVLKSQSEIRNDISA